MGGHRNDAARPYYLSGRNTSQITSGIPQDYLDALAALPEAEAFFRTLDRKNLYPIYYRLQTAKRPETRARRMQQILEQLGRGERFHCNDPQPDIKSPFAVPAKQPLVHRDAPPAYPRGTAGDL